MSQIVNAIIDSVTMKIERGCFLSAHVFVNYGDSGGQGFGGFVLGGTPGVPAGQHLEQVNLAAMWLIGVMRAAGVDDYMQAPGKAIRVQKSDGWGGMIEGIGHITKDDRWFFPANEFPIPKDEP